MKIVSVDVVLVDEPAVTPAFRWRDGLPGSAPAQTAAWLVLTTDEGLRGFGYCNRGAILQDLVDRRIRGELLGADPLMREYTWPARSRLKSAAAWSLDSKTKEVVRWIGTARAPVAGSGAAPACRASVSKPGSE